MGADLLGYMVFMPANVTDEQWQQSEEQVRRVRDIYERYKSVVDWGTETEDGLDQELTAVGAWNEPDFGHEYTLDYYERAFGSTTPEDPDDPVDLVMYKLREGITRGRDVAERGVPGDSETVVVFAGEMSWGDEPTGWGYVALQIADRFGLFPILNIR